MTTRRDFFRTAALCSGAGLYESLMAPIAKAAAIGPEPDSSFLDAEHIVILMQENRSFDHSFGCLAGVRGFADPRAMVLENGNPVWLQTAPSGTGHTPFRLDIQQSNATWTGSLPHSWDNQVDARNDGKHDGWLAAKASDQEAYAGIPLCLGYHDRRDLPFYYALADAFTICDQYFSSSLTGTTPNRLYHWTGTIRHEQTSTSKPYVFNEYLDFHKEAHWRTFPERLSEAGVGWRIYQNELSIPSGLSGEEDDWLGNFTDNPLEWFSQYRVRFSRSHRNELARQQSVCEATILDLLEQLAVAPSPQEHARLQGQLAQQEATKAQLTAELSRWSAEAFAALSPDERALHERAFCTNLSDPAYRTLTSLSYDTPSGPRSMRVPQGDVLHQLRADIAAGDLPFVSWVVAPANFSDHPMAAWYGAWYVAQIFEALTANPEVWKKTIFILNYDENDGFFDHVPPFVPPHPDHPASGLASAGLAPASEQVDRQQLEGHEPAAQVRESPIGLGFRVPAIIASPWSRGGCVCSEVFDHTSVLQFLERMVQHKSGRPCVESNISPWRRAICGDLSSAFQSYDRAQQPALAFPSREDFLSSIHRAQFEKMPSNFASFSPQEMAAVRAGSLALPLPQQEKGLRRSAPLPYQLVANARCENQSFALSFAAEALVSSKDGVGAPFIVHRYLDGGELEVRNYALRCGDALTDHWFLRDNETDYHFMAYGPNGFMREFVGHHHTDPQLLIACEPQKDQRGNPNGLITMKLTNLAKQSYSVLVDDQAYGQARQEIEIPGQSNRLLVFDPRPSFQWYDLRLTVRGHETYAQRYAGRVEMGQWSFTDPVLGRA